ncbi:MAG: hypothetical protein COV55_02815 [Candidatus Komeilibacteria bacterium CG11_big_fil_rev_8_21_14_0_20_36_20]|uniref:DNA polymerase I n=1 Tax=Candidatus Komeilibacteria bacterium CG11_big_fil_rev_8_21_14_0_20_36_20 TaxID=1974477 RepID=A0A2H0NCN9_9BACT|nr:MAG: hypothetical protein COV55_02815 [Candidatus Komeilibacteria bacterium CG11_big_fil_rev_8_21_14_0_20_36_20]
MLDYRFSTIADVRSLIDSNKPLMFDTETQGFYGRIRLAQFYQEDWPTIIFVEYPSPYELVSLLSKQHIIMHNAHYDITTIQDNLGKQKWIPEKFDCTFLLARLHFFLKEKFNFTEVVYYVTGERPYEDNEQGKSDWSVPVLSESQKQYAAADVYYLQKVYDIVKVKQEDFSYKLDILTTRNCLDFQNNGMPVNRQKIRERFIKNNSRINEIGLPINCNSYKQVRAYIDTQNSDDLGLAKLALQGNTKAANVRETRKLVKNNSFLAKFINTMAEYSSIEPCPEDDNFGLLYGKFKCSARSGRTTSDDQNLQQLPRSLKSLFGVPENGDTILIYSDFSQMQLRCVCAKTGDKKMEELFRAGEDLHNYVAEMIFGKNFMPEQRQICKTANFGLLFGAGLGVFLNILIKSADLFLDEKDGKQFIKDWLTLWIAIDNWQQLGIKDWRSKKPWQTPLGRRYTAKLMTDQLAMQIQGFEAEVAKLAMHYMLPKLKEISKDIQLRNFVHDNYIFTAPNNDAVYMPASKIIADAMQDAWQQMCQSVTITDLPMPVNIRVGWNWGDIESGTFIYEYNQ